MDPKADKLFQILKARVSHLNVLRVVLVVMVLKKSLSLGVDVRINKTLGRRTMPCTHGRESWWLIKAYYTRYTNSTHLGILPKDF